MATCKDCLHHKACSADNENYFMLIGCVNVESNCIDFVDKSNFVEVVRCKDCKHCRNSVYPFIDHTLRECKVWKSATREDDFCSYGERREGE